jgi:hypothetical protein
VSSGYLYTVTVPLRESGTGFFGEKREAGINNTAWEGDESPEISSSAYLLIPRGLILRSVEMDAGGMNGEEDGWMRYIFEVRSILDRDLSCCTREGCGDCWRLHCE